jgi:Zn-dependent M16 (insulinase) family peptidase
VGKGANLFELGYELDGSIEVARKYLGTTYIYEKIRIQGGAYGAFLVFYPNSGTLNYVSYRDPNLVSSVDSYDGTPDFLRGLELDKGELVKSIIGTIGDMDLYQLPDAKGFTSLTRYLIGYTNEERQRIRDEVLSANAEDFKALADVLDMVAKKGIVIALGSAEAIQAANKERPGFLEMKKVM